MQPTDWTGAESSGLRRVRPQRVEHVDGWAVASSGRDAVSYDEGERHTEVGIDRGLPSSRLYVDTLEWVDERGDRAPVLEPERSVLLERIVLGHGALRRGPAKLSTAELKALVKEGGSATVPPP